jgi:prolyl-tRNA editing enzyme YbaK/EbsC (Cys-tRNA(Pro) deacylase)
MAYGKVRNVAQMGRGRASDGYSFPNNVCPGYTASGNEKELRHQRLTAEQVVNMNLDSGHLSKYITLLGIEAEIVDLEQETPTVAAAAEAVGVSPEQIIKSVLFLADKRPVLVIANGFNRIDRKKLADHLGVSRRRVKIANAQQVLAISGYYAGTVPPFGHKERLHTVMDSAVLAQVSIYGGGGGIRTLMRLTLAELQRVIGAETTELVEIPRP